MANDIKGYQKNPELKIFKAPEGWQGTTLTMQYWA